jgi:hypothetical protein
MPFIVPFIPLIAAGVTAGTSIGIDLSNQDNGPKAPTPAQISQSAVEQATQQREGQAKNAAQVLPDLQYQTGGGLSPDSLASFSATDSGNPGLQNSSQLQQLVAQFLGTGNNSFGGNSSFGTSGGLT